MPSELRSRGNRDPAADGILLSESGFPPVFEIRHQNLALLTVQITRDSQNSSLCGAARVPSTFINSIICVSRSVVSQWSPPSKTALDVAGVCRWQPSSGVVYRSFAVDSGAVARLFPNAPKSAADRRETLPNSVHTRQIGRGVYLILIKAYRADLLSLPRLSKISPDPISFRAGKARPYIP